MKKILLRFNNTFSKNKTAGFTIVEVIVVIVVIGILAAVAIVGYDGWNKRVVETQIKSDLNGAAVSMENYKNFNDGYPSLIPTNFTASKDVTLSLSSSNSKEYCIDATSSRDSSVHYYIDESNKDSGAQVGICADRP